MQPAGGGLTGAAAGDPAGAVGRAAH
jgi:hypothetical protein